jgi:hypothetical protein
MVFGRAKRAACFEARIILQHSGLRASKSKDDSNSLISYGFVSEISILDERRE